ncbi:Coenzyme F420 hydrogenase/dehydrogenase, beta subunit C-terminal domain [Cellulomonas endophytica]|uniref:Coenzyme F420 hydrogenase/dehydrogenase, beta subunit C-terminal domain n=1 Tax=Cellulomonas endophytica TaxID=2494735 RepID=UPI00196A319D|nr:Coenzyme F420 hydrogenase/dehydrogenase, beta subunit C-terminal domain [Cellulomonas endophytica]
MSRDLDTLLAEVRRAESCTGCGVCTLLDPGLEMGLTDDGYLRPHRTAGTTPVPGAGERFARVCPAVHVDAQRPEGSQRHPQLGPVVAVYEAAAADPELRRQGSSGGVLTALSSWLVSTGEASHVVGARAGADEPRRTVPVRITSRDEALRAAGSRYAPVAVGSRGDVGPGAAVVGKPCEATALRALELDEGRPGPLLLSFFCAGTPSQHATTQLLDGLGVAGDEALDDLWYRGRGWPGRFTARTLQGREVSASYEESWGSTLGKQLQWRCKICPDGIGESSDITAGDFWRSDERGYPVFEETDGYSALVVRTRRGADVVERAVAAGVLTVRPITPDEVMAVQPLQRKRRATLLGRLLGARLAGTPVPRYRGFGLLGFAVRRPREIRDTVKDTFLRRRKVERAHRR